MYSTYLSGVHANYLNFSQDWLATVTDVLQADWQDAWHLPQPPPSTVSLSNFVFTVLICFMQTTPSRNYYAIAISVTSNFITSNLFLQ